MSASEITITISAIIGLVAAVYAYRSSKIRDASVVSAATISSDYLKEKYDANEEELRKTKERNRRIEIELRDTLEENKHLANTLTHLKEKMQNSEVVSEVYYPVVLVGGRDSGKSSLRHHWGASWQVNAVEPTQVVSSVNIPVYDFVKDTRRPHPWADDVLVLEKVHLYLRTYDFPGEIINQKDILKVAERETQRIASEYKRQIGMCMLIMIDSSAMIDPATENETKNYFSSPGYLDLCDRIRSEAIAIDRVVVMYNKADKLRSQYGHFDDRALLSECDSKLGHFVRDTLPTNIMMFRVLSILGSESKIPSKGLGASEAMGHCARRYIEVVKDGENSRHQGPFITGGGSQKIANDDNSI